MAKAAKLQIEAQEADTLAALHTGGLTSGAARDFLDHDAGPARTHADDPATRTRRWIMTTATAYERLLDRLKENGCRYREGANQTMAQCPSHYDREASLAIYREDRRIRVHCYADCDDALDILPALGLGVRDLFDEPGQRGRSYPPNPAVQGRIEARRKMTPAQRAVDDLLHLPDLGERFSAEPLRGTTTRNASAEVVVMSDRPEGDILARLQAEEAAATRSTATRSRTSYLPGCVPETGSTHKCSRHSATSYLGSSPRD